MNNITLLTREFKAKAPDGSGSSLRVDSSTGLNTPTVISIRQQAAKNSATKGPAHRSSVRIARDIPVRDGAALQPAAIVLSFEVPLDASVTFALVEDLVLLTKDLLASETLRTEIFEDRLT